MNQDQNRWESLRRDGGKLLSSGFASHVMKQARVIQRRRHAVRVTAAAISLFVAGAASTRWVVNTVIDHNQGAIQSAAKENTATGSAVSQPGATIADNDPLFTSVSKILFPTAAADLVSISGGSPVADDRIDSNDQDELWAQACGGDAKCLVYYEADSRSANNQENVW